MRESLYITNQANAIDALARILHVKRNKVANLLARKKHPLPLPPSTPSADRYEINDLYRQRLLKWVVEERAQHTRHESQKLDLSRVEKELRVEAVSEPGQEDWSVEESIDSYPPGMFLG